MGGQPPLKWTPGVDKTTPGAIEGGHGYPRRHLGGGDNPRSPLRIHHYSTVYFPRNNYSSYFSDK